MGQDGMMARQADAQDMATAITAPPPDKKKPGGRSARSGRQAKLLAREGGAQERGLGRPYILRNIPTYDILGKESLLAIEKTADRILAEIGIDFRGDPESLRLWKEAGAKVTGDRVTFEPGMLHELLKTAPRQFTQHARNPANTIEVGGKSIVFAPAYGSPFVMDLDKGRRYGTIEDFRNFVKLAQSSPWLHHSGGTICEPTDIAVNKRHLDMVYAHLRYSDRPFMGSITAEERAEDSIAMARLVFGEDFVDSHCVILGGINVNSPLVWDGTMTKSIRAYARANQAPVVVPFILGGAMGPVTNAGAIAQAHAETMAGCALGQLERRGSPVVYGNFLSSMSLRSGSPTFGTPEPAIGSMVVGQLARRLGLPLRCSGNFTTSKLPDAQAMNESTMSMLAAIHCGANFILHSAGFLDGLLSMSYEKFVMDCDFCGALHTYCDGMVVDENTLAMDAFHEVGPGSHFFGSQHTLRNYQTAFWDSALADNDPFETWEDNGSLDMATRANTRWKAVLADYKTPPMDEAVDEQLLDFIKVKKASMEDAWY